MYHRWHLPWWGGLSHDSRACLSCGCFLQEGRFAATLGGGEQGEQEASSDLYLWPEGSEGQKEKDVVQRIICQRWVRDNPIGCGFAKCHSLQATALAGCANGLVGCVASLVGCATGPVGCAIGLVGCAADFIVCATGPVCCALVLLVVPQLVWTCLCPCQLWHNIDMSTPTLSC